MEENYYLDSMNTEISDELALWGVESNESLYNIYTKKTNHIYYKDPTENPNKNAPIGFTSLSGNKNDGVINTYKNTLKKSWVLKEKEVTVNWANVTIILNCYEIPRDDKHHIPGLTWQGDKYQYDLRNKGYKVERPVAWKIPFLKHTEYDNDNYTVSHLCHNDQCYNWNHHVLETLPVNKGRNGCSGLGCCHHKTRCIIPGPYHDS